MNIYKDSAFINGIIASPYYATYTSGDGSHYKVFVKAARLSGAEDTIPVIVPESCLEDTLDATGRHVAVSGQYCSRNYYTDGKRHLDIYLYAEQFVFTNGQEGQPEADGRENNRVILEGFLCKKPVYRRTPLGREITDLMVAINWTGECRGTYYIPCIAWGRTAALVSRADTGDFIGLEGRFQSREYIKRTQDGDDSVECRKVAYEVSCKALRVIEEKAAPPKNTRQEDAGKAAAGAVAAAAS